MTEAKDRRARVRIATIVAVVVAAMGVVASPAGAATSHVLKGSFGAAGSTPANPHPLSEPTDLGVDESDHSVWVTDPGHRRIEKFDAAGNFILMVGGGVDQT